MTSKEAKVVYVTKYALTSGITKELVHKTGTPTMVETTGCFLTTYYHKPDWHDTEKEARTRTAHMIGKKIASVQKQLDRLKKLHAADMPITDQTKNTKTPSLTVGPE